MSLRTWRDQFANSTSLDGNRLDRLLRHIVARFNKLEPQDLAARCVETRMVMTLHPTTVSPATSGAQDKLPFMGISNFNDPSQMIGTIPIQGFQNEWRLKGTDVPAINVQDTTTSDDQLAWTTSLYFDKPTVLDGLSLAVKNNTTSWPYPPDDLFVIVSVDDVWLRENRKLNAVVLWQSRPIVASNGAITLFNLPSSPMLPEINAVSKQLIYGHYRDFQHLNIQLPEKARVRISFVISRYPVATGKYQYPWGGSLWSCTADFLEHLESA